MVSNVTDSPPGADCWVYSHQSNEGGWFVTTHWFQRTRGSAEVICAGIEFSSYDAGSETPWDRPTYLAEFPEGSGREVTRSALNDLPFAPVMHEHKQVVTQALADEAQDHRRDGWSEMVEQVEQWRAQFARARGNDDRYLLAAEIHASLPPESRAPSKEVHRILNDELGHKVSRDQTRKWIQRGRALRSINEEKGS